MGCDINGFAEWRFTNSDPDKASSWSLIAPVPNHRSYRVFELLADIRTTGDIEKQFTDLIPLRGIPASHARVEEPHGIYVGDFGFTWYTLDELQHTEMWDQIEHDTPRELWKSFLTYLEWFGKSWWECEIRIVIGFDN